MRSTIIDTKELHYNSYYKDLQRFRGQQDSQDYIHQKITMSPTIIENRKLLSSSYLVCSSTCTKQSFRGHIYMNHTKGEQSNLASSLIHKEHQEYLTLPSTTQRVHPNYIQITQRVHSIVLTRLEEWAASFFRHERPCVTQGL